MGRGTRGARPAVQSKSPIKEFAAGWREDVINPSSALCVSDNPNSDVGWADNLRGREGVRYAEEILALYVKVYPFFSVVPLLILPPRISSSLNLD